jgi:hypothetical protein
MLHITIQKQINDDIFSPIGIWWEKNDVEQRDKSHVGPQGEKTYAYKIQLLNDMWLIWQN